MSSNSIKAAIRVEIKNKLKVLAGGLLQEESNRVIQSLKDLPDFINSKGVCVYLSMRDEINTYPIINESFQMSKRVIIPKVMGKNAKDMVMLDIATEVDIESFPKNAWGIPEPTVEYARSAQDCTYNGSIDLILVPGVAFDRKCGRLGHGKGYYGMKC